MREMTDKTPILGLILAGGLGRRMGKPQKPLLELGGAKLIDRVVARARGQCDALAINLHELTPESVAPFADCGLPLLADAAPGHAGPLAGVLAGLDHAAKLHLSHVVSLPCDCPFLPDDLFAKLLDAARKTSDGFARAASGGRDHPVIALWPTRSREALRRALDEGARKVGQFQQNYDVATVEWFFSARDPFFNINTPDDFLRAQELLARTEEA